ncbi:MAG TPA: cation transporter [Candidatus Acidoferrales bacterium]|nr:cation transporter [Candidatus Acidoferrales bacterium]
MAATITYTVAGMTCDHCRMAVTKELTAVGGVETVAVDLDSKLVTVTGVNLDDTAMRAAIDEAGYEAA